jgi:hypothetical protein
MKRWDGIYKQNQTDTDIGVLKCNMSLDVQEEKREEPKHIRMNLD